MLRRRRICLYGAALAFLIGDMDREYDIFEKRPDGEVMWRGSVRGHESAITKLKELAANSLNEHFVLHLPTNAIVARINAPADAR